MLELYASHVTCVAELDLHASDLGFFKKKISERRVSFISDTARNRTSHEIVKLCRL